MQRFRRQHVNGSKTLLRLARNQFQTNLPLIWKRRSRKNLVLVRSEFLGQFVHTLTADYQYSRQNRENFWEQVPMQISRKLKIFSGSLIAFLESMLNLEYFQKKDQSHSLSITEISNCKTGSYLKVQKAIFHTTLLETTCYRVQNTTGIRTEPVSYHSPINLRKKE